MNIRKALNGLAVLAVLAMMGGCVSFPSEPVKFRTEYPNGTVVTMVGYNKILPDYMYDVDTLKVAFAVKGDVTPDHFKVVGLTETTCQKWTRTMHPNKVLSVVLRGSVTAIGGAGLGYAAQSLDRTNPAQYRRYGSTGGFFAGMAGGVGSLATQTDTMGGCFQANIGFVPELGIKYVPVGIAY